MGWFSSKFSQMQTEEEKYAARSQVAPTQSRPTSATDRKVERWGQAHPIAGPARVLKNSEKVAKVGTITKRGNKYILDGWTFTDPTLPAGPLKPGTKSTHIAGLSVAELCDVYEFETGRKIR